MNVVAYDRWRRETRDAVHTMNARSPESPGSMEIIAWPDRAPNEKSLAREQARRVSYQAELARLDLEERLGKLVPVDDIFAAIREIAEVFVRGFEQLPGQADELAAAPSGKSALKAPASSRNRWFMICATSSPASCASSRRTVSPPLAQLRPAAVRMVRFGAAI